MSTCDDFKENSWRRDLCRNCQRPRLDHACVAAEIPADVECASEAGNSGSSTGGPVSPRLPKNISVTTEAEGSLTKCDSRGGSPTKPAVTQPAGVHKHRSNQQFRPPGSAPACVANHSTNGPAAIALRQPGSTGAVSAASRIQKLQTQPAASLRKSLGPPPSIPEVASKGQRKADPAAEANSSELGVSLSKVPLAVVTRKDFSLPSPGIDSNNLRRPAARLPESKLPASPCPSSLANAPPAEPIAHVIPVLEAEHIYAEIVECVPAAKQPTVRYNPRGVASSSRQPVGPAAAAGAVKGVSRTPSKYASEQRQGKVKMALFRNIFKKGKKDQAEIKTGSSYVNDWVSQTTAPGEDIGAEKNGDATGAMKGVWPYDPKANFGKSPSADEPSAAGLDDDVLPVIFDERSLTELIVEAERQRVGARKSLEGKPGEPAQSDAGDLYDLPWFDSTLTIQSMLKQVERSSTTEEAERPVDVPERFAATHAHTDNESSSDAEVVTGISKRKVGAQNGTQIIRSESYLEPKQQAGDSMANGWTSQTKDSKGHANNSAVQNAQAKDSKGRGNDPVVQKVNGSGYASDSAAQVKAAGEHLNGHVSDSAVRSNDKSGYVSDTVPRNAAVSAVPRNKVFGGYESDTVIKSKGSTSNGQGTGGARDYESDSAPSSKHTISNSTEPVPQKSKESNTLTDAVALRTKEPTSDNVSRTKEPAGDPITRSKDNKVSTTNPVLPRSTGSSSRLSDTAAQGVDTSGQIRETSSRASGTSSVRNDTYLQHSKTLQTRRSEANLSYTSKETGSSSGQDIFLQRSKENGGRSRNDLASQNTEGSLQSGLAAKNLAYAQGTKTLHTRRSEASFSADSTASRRDLGNVTEDDGYYSENRTLLRHSNSRSELAKNGARKESSGYATLRRTDKNEGSAAQPPNIVTAAAILDKVPETPAEGFFHMSSVATESLRKLCEEGRNKTAPIPESVLTRQRMSWDDFSFTSDTPLHSNRYCIFHKAALKGVQGGQLMLMVSLKEPKTTLTARSPHVFGCKPLFEMDVPMRMIPSSFLAANQPSSGQQVRGTNGSDFMSQDSFGQYDKPWHESSKAAVKSLESSYHAGLLNTEKFQQDSLKCFVTVLPPITEEALSLSSLLQAQKTPTQDESKKQRDTENLFQILLQVVKVVTSLFFDSNTLCISLKPEDILLTKRKREPYMIMLAPGNLRKSDVGSGFVVCAQLRKLFEEVAACCPPIHGTPGFARLEKLIQSASEMGDVKAIVKVWETVAWGPSEKEVRTLCLADDRDAAFEIWLQVQRLKHLCMMASDTISSVSVPMEQFEKGLFLCSVTGVQLFAVSKLLHAK